MQIELAQISEPGGGQGLLPPRAKAILGAALIFVAAAVLSPDGLARLTFTLTALVLGGAAAWVGYRLREAGRGARDTCRMAALLGMHDPLPCVLTGPELGVLHANPAARARFAAPDSVTLSGLLEDEIANPPALLHDMAAEARARGSARRALGGAARSGVLSVNRVDQGPAPPLYWWRIVEPAPPAAPPPEACMPEEACADPRSPLAGGERRPRPEARSLPDLSCEHAPPVLRLDADGALRDASPAARALFGWSPSGSPSGSLSGSLSGSFCGLPPAPPPEIGIAALANGRIGAIDTPQGRVSCLPVWWPRGDGGRDLFLFPADGAAGAGDDWDFVGALPVPLLKLSRDGRILLSNPPALKLLGIASGEGRRLGQLIEGPGRPVADWLDDAADGQGTIRAEIVPVRRDDREVYVQVALTRVQEGAETVLIAVLHDVTEMKSLEAQFTQSQKMQAIGQLAGGVAHDFNNLLTAISGHCDLLLLRHDAHDADYADLMQIAQNANRAASLASQLLAFSRKQTLRPEVMDLRDMLLELTHLLNRLVGEKVHLSLHQEPALWPVRADRRQMEQVVMNLVVNARDAMPEGGEIRIETANRLLREPLRRDRAVVAPGRYVELTVRDEGVGIEPGHLPKLFEPFFTTKRPGEGTGLGLSTVYGILKQTGGFIFVDSAPGAGARFMILLPALEAGVAPPPPAPAPPQPARRRSHGVVLLVEDEAPVRAFASRALKMRGLSVLEAGSGEEALELLRAGSQGVDVIVTDVILPGMDGPSWVREALQLRPEMRVVFVSGYAPQDLGVAQEAAGAAVFLPKPFSLEELTETVQRQLQH